MMKLKPNSHVHLMGVGGTAMASLAGLLKQKGYQVTGSDQGVYPPMSDQLAALGISVMEGYQAENLHPAPDFVVVGNVITRVNPEAQELLSSKIPYASLPEVMGELVLGSRDSYVISGTHGKTTTTALAAWVMTELGLQPGFMVGGIPVNFKKSFDFGEGNCFVIEGDEYDTAFFDKVPKFTHYRPKFVVLTSVEFDHADIYSDMEQIRSAFKKLVSLIPQEGLLVYNSGSDEVQKIAADFQGAKISYGVSEGELRATDYTLSEEGMRFQCVYKGESLGEFESSMFGEHNLLNHLAVLGYAVHHRWPLDSVREAFKSFKGVKRRQEILGRPRDIWVIEDFAHHPSAVQLTIEAMKKRFPKARLFSLFEPRSATSRRNIFQEDYARAFLSSDTVWIAPPFHQENIPPAERFSSESLVVDLKSRGVDARVLTSDQMVESVQSEARPGDVVLVMSNGAFDGIYAKLLKTLA